LRRDAAEIERLADAAIARRRSNSAGTLDGGGAAG
jgi:hypothetical protein